jgi:tRNA(Ile)-lysidine synthase
MLSQLARTIAQHRLVTPGERVLVAVSGGPDSTALLHGLARLSARLGIALHAATVDHGLRPGSAAEGEAVAASSAELGVPCERLRVDVGAARGPHVSLQDAARRARLAALADAADRLSCARVALGHTGDDQAETVLFRIVRGTGLAGLAGIPYARGRFVRPLLDVRRAAVLAFLKRRRLSFVEDPSNRDRRFTRTRVRHEWLALLGRENPRVVEALLALAREARTRGPAPPAREALQPHVGRAARATIATLAARGHGTRHVSFAGGIAEIAYGRVTLRASIPPPGRAAPVTASLGVPGPGVYRWQPVPELAPLAVEVALVEGENAPRPGEATFDAGCLSQGLCLRAPRPGDRMRPRGGRGSRKLQDLLVDAKIPRDSRAALPALVTGAGTILYVPGLRPADEGRPPPGASRWLEVRTFRA